MPSNRCLVVNCSGMYNIEEIASKEGSRRNENHLETNMFSSIDYGQSNFQKLDGLVENPMESNEENSYNVEREIYSTELDNIQEQEILVGKVVEYYVPTTINYDFAKMFDIPSKANDFGLKGDALNIYDRTPSADFPCRFTGSNLPRNDVNLVQSKSETRLKNPCSRYLKDEDILTRHEKNESLNTIKKYSNTFLHSERTLQELNQQNMLAQELLKKYFKDDASATKIEHKQEKSDLSACIDKRDGVKSLHTVSSLIKRYFKHTDKNEQVCIKPSDNYIFLNNKEISGENLNQKSGSVKFVRPFRYHKKYWDSGSNFEIASKIQPPFQFECSPRKRSRLEFESNVALKQDSSTDASLKTENVQFLEADSKRCRKSSSQQNELLYKTDSKNFENTYSFEELHAFMPERYMSLRNLYGYNYIESRQEQMSKPRFNFQTLPNKNSTSGELVVKLFDSGSHIKVTDDDYKKWLKENDFIKYTDFANSSVSSITFRSISQKIVNYSISPGTKSKERKRSRHNIRDKSYQIGLNKLINNDPFPSLTASLTNHKFVDVEYNNLYQLFLYEHIVISNAINFYCTFNAARIKKLNVLDRMYQLMFLLFCYYMLSLINNSVFSHNEVLNWF